MGLENRCAAVSRLWSTGPDSAQKPYHEIPHDFFILLQPPFHVFVVFFGNDGVGEGFFLEFYGPQPEARKRQPQVSVIFRQEPDETVHRVDAQIDGGRAVFPDQIAAESAQVLNAHDFVPRIKEPYAAGVSSDGVGREVIFLKLFFKFLNQRFLCWSYHNVSPFHDLID